MFSLYSIILFLFNFILSIDSNNVTVQTFSGLVIGSTVQVLNKSIDTFLGIPFAEPPVGDLRFAKPQSLKQSRNKIIDGTKPGKSCIQWFGMHGKYKGFNPDLDESEDCLVLNIWSPKSSANETTALKPVMFWIYGGAFQFGSIFLLNLYDGKYLATNDVVVVSANYRLGAFGFLYGDTESAPGNIALYDQVMALKWIKENIHAFGGNNNRITIFGESAGSISAGALILSPIARNLFQRAILQSGSPFLYRGNKTIISLEVTREQALLAAINTSKQHNCSGNQWLECLRNIDAQQLNDNNTIPTSIIYETEFLPFESAQNAFRNQNYSKDIELLSGVTRDEGMGFVSKDFPQFFKNVTKHELELQLKKLFEPEIDSELMSKTYLSNIDESNQTALKRAFGSVFGDQVITCSTHFFAQEFAKYSPKSVYFYELTYKKVYAEEIHNACKPEWMGVCHGSDLTFVFGQPFSKRNESNEIDINFTQLIINLWTNFAKYGNPISGNSSIIWPTLKNSSDSKVISEIMELNPYNFGNVLKEPFLKTCDQFWKKYFYYN